MAGGNLSLIPQKFAHEIFDQLVVRTALELRNQYFHDPAKVAHAFGSQFLDDFLNPKP